MGYHPIRTAESPNTPLPPPARNYTIMQQEEQKNVILTGALCKRTVSFSPYATLRLIYSVDGGDNKTAESSWYSEKELEHFRTVARDEGRSVHTTRGECTKSTNPSTRGLEQRACHERQRRRTILVKCVVKRAVYAITPACVANYSRCCTRYATDLAVQEAARDYYHVYGEECILSQKKHGRNEQDEDIPLSKRNRPHVIELG